jgi:pimeloyl-ACP methyl ester carboxylesterase
MNRDVRAVRPVGMLLALLAGSCDGELGREEPAAPVPATFTPAPCPAMPPPGIAVECGSVQVPESAGRPAEVTLAVALINLRDQPRPSDRMAFLAGPAGASGISYAFYYAGWTADASLRALLARRTMVAIDLRGTGGARPDLRCPGVRVAPLPETSTAIDPATATDLQECRARLGGVPLESYGTAQAAQDVDTVRRALGAARWDLVGVDYGARVALEVIRQHPAGVRAAVLDSVAPPQVDALAAEAPNAARALLGMQRRCAEDPLCHAKHPDPLGVLSAMITRLDAAPVSVGTHGGTVMLTGASFLAATLQTLQDPDGAGRLPARLDEAQAGSLDFFAAVLGAPRGEGSLGLHLSVICAEAMPRSSRTAIEAGAAAASPSLRPALSGRFYALACPLWPLPVAPPALAQPVEGKTPVLLLAGGHDPLTHPEWAQTIATGFTSSWVVPFADQGHALLRSRCPAALAAAFLEDPTRAPVPPCPD